MPRSSALLTAATLSLASLAWSAPPTATPRPSPPRTATPADRSAAAKTRLEPTASAEPTNASGLSRRVIAGPLTLDIVVAQTPQLFHTVDQLSAWSPFCHRQYRRWFAAPEHGGLSAEDDALLAEHAKLRAKDGWGGLDALFVDDVPLETALASAMKTGRLTAADAEIERRVLTHFRPRETELISQRRAALEAFAVGVEGSRAALTTFATQASRFFGGVTVTRKIVLAASPSDDGGGANGGVLLVEVNGTQSPLEVLQHECWHAFAEGSKDALAAAAREAGSDYETLSEGLAYAVMPGLFPPSDDPERLAHTVASDFAQKNSYLDDPYVRFNRIALALRPSLEPLLRGKGTITDLLPIETALVRGLTALALAEADGHPPGVFWFGPWEPSIGQRVQQQHLSVWGRDLKQAALDELRPRIRPKDHVVLAIADTHVIPGGFEELLGPDAQKLFALRREKASGEVRLVGRRGEDMRVVWAPTRAELLQSVRNSAMLDFSASDAGR